jgi:hypothetical protein
MGGPNSRAERFAEEKEKTLVLTGIPTALSRLPKEKKFIPNCSSKISKNVTDTSTILKRILEYDMT